MAERKKQKEACVVKMVQMLVFGTVLAGTSAQAAAVDPAMLGRMKGVLEVCGAVRPQEAGQYLLAMKERIGDADRKAVDEATRTEAYRESYDAVRADLGGRASGDLPGACDTYLSER